MFVKCLCLVVALALVGVQCNLLQELDHKLDDARVRLEDEFRASTQSLLWDQRGKASEWQSSPAGVQAANELFDMAQWATFVEMLRYATRRKSLTIAKEILRSKSLLDNGMGSFRYDNIYMPAPLLASLVSRAILRGYADGYRYSDHTFRRVHKLIEHHQGAAHMAPLAAEIYKQKLNFNSRAYEAAQEYEATMRGALSEMGSDDKMTRASLEAVIDRIISRAAGCELCQSKLPDSEYLGTGPMFDGDDQVRAAIEQYVDPNIQGAFVDVNTPVYEPSPEEVARVSKQDIESLMKKTLSL